MAVFRYEAITADGKKSGGVLDAESARQARAKLRDQGMTPLDVFSAAPARRTASGAWGKRTSELTLLYRVLGNLLDAGVELADALDSASQQASIRGRGLYLAIRAEIVQGVPLSEAIRRVEPNISSMVPAVLAAGEHSGHLSSVLLGLADYADRAASMRSRIGIALIYPLVLIVVSGLVVVALMAHVVPEIVRVFEGFEQQLPWLTRVLITASEFLRAWWWLMIAGAIVAVLIGRSAVGRERRSGVLDAVLLRVPGIAGLYAATERERFLDTLAMLLQGAVSIQEALRAAAAVMRSARLKLAVEQVAKDVERGRALNVALQESELLTPVTLQLVSAGVESSRLAQMVSSAARIERTAVETRLSVVIGLVEPALILLMGAVVLMIVIAILLPVFELNRLVA